VDHACLTVTLDENVRLRQNGNRAPEREQEGMFLNSDTSKVARRVNSTKGFMFWLLANRPCVPA